jgi:divalent metal cation (Fe/Co/Zn/Cd) transporter
MLSEGAHSISDTVNELFLVASVRRSERSADEVLGAARVQLVEGIRFSAGHALGDRLPAT